MNKQAELFLESYPLTHDGQCAIDSANAGNIVPLVRILTGAVTAISKLRANQTIKRSSAAIGLQNYYRGQINALISLVKSDYIRQSLESVYKGDS